MASIGKHFEPSSSSTSRHSTTHTPFSIPKLLTAVFAIAGSCSALVADSRSPASLAQRGTASASQTISSIKSIQSHEPNRAVENSISLSFSLSGTATPIATSVSSSSSSSDSSGGGSSSTTDSASKTSSSTASSFTGLPQPFDTPLGNNFTSTTCPTLFQKIISDPAVRNCVPVSLLLQGSRSFFNVETSASGLSRTLDISCNAISATCDALFQSYALSVASTNGCKAELQAQNQRVQILFNGLISYLPIYNAACLQVSATNASTNPTNKYCFKAAVENEINSYDLLLYTLPLGLPLPSGSSPTCSSCTQKTMAIFADAARNLTSPLSTDYVPAAVMVNAACGANFVAATFTPIPGSDTISAANSLDGRRLTTFGLSVMITAGLVMML